MFRSLSAIVATLLLLASSLPAQPVALSVNPASREEVRQFYRAVYAASENVPMAWTGNYATGNAGDTSPAFKEATRLRINFFRALAGVPAGITFNATYSAKNQQAALMESVNSTTKDPITGNVTIALNHFPPASWTFYTAAGAEAAGNSNISYGTAGPDAITGYIVDNGAGNQSIGHRRWLFYPQTLQMGTGDVPGDGTQTRDAANAVWILVQDPAGAPGTFGSARPATRTLAVPYPPAGYVPHTLVWPRWSFSYPGADFSSATVTMSRAGQSVATVLEPLSLSSGEPTLVWVYGGLDSTAATIHPKPTADTTYTVNVNNVKIGGVAQNFSYNVIVFDPDAAGADFAPVAVTGPAAASLGASNAYTIAKPSFAGGAEWRSLQLAAFSKTYGAESGLDGLAATTSSDYSVVQSIAVGSGGSSYRLAHVTPRTSQILLLPETFYVGDAGAAIAFLSRLGIATSVQVARVQVSTDDGSGWTDVYTQAGTSATNTSTPASTDSAFTTRTASLAAFAGRTVRVRLNFTIEPTGIAFIPNATNTVGWFIDNLTLTGVQSVTAGAATGVTGGGTGFSFASASAGRFGLQARGVLFGTYPLEWGPVAALTVTDPAVAANPGRLINLSVLTDLSAAVPDFTAGIVVGGAGTSGTQALLVRAAGPALGALGVPGTLSDPKLEFYAGQTVVASNDDWAGTAALSTAIAQVGAFPYASAASKDSALFNAAFPARDYTVKVSGAPGATGTVIAEIYDATPAGTFTPTSPRLVNVSVLKQISAGGSLTLGFTIGGASSKTVLIRAIGPALGLAPFFIGGAMTDPQLTLFNSSSIAIKSNNDWAGDPQVAAAMTATGAFQVTNTASKDAMLVMTLAPGGYTAQASGVAGSAGFTIVEVYEVP